MAFWEDPNFVSYSDAVHSALDCFVDGQRRLLSLTEETLSETVDVFISDPYWAVGKRVSDCFGSVAGARPGLNGLHIEFLRHFRLGAGFGPLDQLRATLRDYAAVTPAGLDGGSFDAQVAPAVARVREGGFQLVGFRGVRPSLAAGRSAREAFGFALELAEQEFAVHAKRDG
jgi:hypothetical protein